MRIVKMASKNPRDFWRRLVAVSRTRPLKKFTSRFTIPFCATQRIPKGASGEVIQVRIVLPSGRKMLTQWRKYRYHRSYGISGKCAPIGTSGPQNSTVQESRRESGPFHELRPLSHTRSDAWIFLSFAHCVRIKFRPEPSDTRGHHRHPRTYAGAP